MQQSHVQDSQLTKLWDAASKVADPEIPVLSIADLGILREVDFNAAGHAVVTITPTYSGCPAMGMIEVEIMLELDKSGFPNAIVNTVLSPPWTTDWMTETGREKLRGYGITPPVKSSNSRRALFGETVVECPRCQSQETERVSEFGSTACKALYRCGKCLEPFDYFKCI